MSANLELFALFLVGTHAWGARPFSFVTAGVLAIGAATSAWFHAAVHEDGGAERRRDMGEIWGDMGRYEDGGAERRRGDETRRSAVTACNRL